LSASKTNNVISYPVVVEVDNNDLKLFPGMTANAEIEVDRREDVLRVANAALRFKPANVKTDDSETKPARMGGGGMLSSELPRIAAELKLDATQQTALDELLAKQKERMAARASGQSGRTWSGGSRQADGAGSTDSAASDSGATRPRMQQRMTHAYAPFRALLSAGQQAIWDSELAKLSSQRRGNIYLLVDGKAVATPVRLGLSDGSYTEVGGGNIKEGDLAIVSEQQEQP
jgi:HlyD family secretion protein